MKIGRKKRILTKEEIIIKDRAIAKRLKKEEFEKKQVKLPFEEKK